MARKLPKGIQQVKVPRNLDKDLHRSFKIYTFYNRKVANLINSNIENQKLTTRQKNLLIGRVITKYTNRIIEIYDEYISAEGYINEKEKNLFVFSGANNLARYSKITKVIGNLIGNCLEEIAQVSPRAVSYEADFNIKVKGVDLVIKDGTRFCHVQLKTKRDTLTGSQSDRVNKELSIFPKSYFVSAFSLGDSWTFISKLKTIKRVEGKEFWDMLELDYQFVVKKIKKMMLELEDYTDSKGFN